ncbi:MAG: GMC family oxidoreductase N-terminal domain-containing protein [Minicystis sp.]
MDAEMIVVGAGSAGAVIASRVTERADREVLLIEAGPDYPDGKVPADLADGTRNSMIAHDWGTQFRPTPGQSVWRFPRGRVVGGSSAVNTCIALRGQPYDFDEWADRGLPAWRWEACRPAFLRLEDDRDIVNEHHHQGGPIPIRRHPQAELAPWQAAFAEGCKELGFGACDDHNGPAPLGYGPHPMNKIDGVRMSAARGYLGPAVRRRANLRIRPRTLVRRVLFTNRRVTGVEVETEGRVEVIRSARVVLSAGAIMTPGILLRSGIGPRDRVARIGVSLVADVPAVAARLLDHPGAAIILAARTYAPHEGVPLLQTMLRYTSTGSPFPGDLQLQPGTYVAFPTVTLPGMSIMCSIGKPKGSGTIEYRSADPHELPQIEGQHLVDPEDRERAVTAMMLAYDLTKTRAMRGLAHYLWPGEATLRDKDALRAWIWQSCGSGYHPCGTVPMGPEGALDAAVDQHGRVRGVEGLHVADASIMPTVPSANINLPALMIGERFGEWLRDGSI